MAAVVVWISFIVIFIYDLPYVFHEPYSYSFKGITKIDMRNFHDT